MLSVHIYNICFNSANLLDFSGNRLYLVLMNNRLVCFVVFFKNMNPSDLLKLSTKRLLTRECVEKLIWTNWKFDFKLC